MIIADYHLLRSFFFFLRGLLSFILIYFGLSLFPSNLRLNFKSADPREDFGN